MVVVLASLTARSAQPPSPTPTSPPAPATPMQTESATTTGYCYDIPHGSSNRDHHGAPDRPIALRGCRDASAARGRLAATGLDGRGDLRRNGRLQQGRVDRSWLAATGPCSPDVSYYTGQGLPAETTLSIVIESSTSDRSWAQLLVHESDVLP